VLAPRALPAAATAAFLLLAAPACAGPPTVAELASADSAASIASPPTTAGTDRSSAPAATPDPAPAVAATTSAAPAPTSRPRPTSTAPSSAEAPAIVAAPVAAPQPAPQPQPAPRPAEPPQAAASGCNSNYDPCVPDDPDDVDCEGGSGNGPSYVAGPVRVVGDDVYGLDRDNDGYGCE
jgi:hypothetical protein